MFICSFCPLENILLMLPIHSESVLWREALLSKWQTSHGPWHWKWMCFCFWALCYQRVFSDACSYLPELAGQWKAKSSSQSLAVYSVSCPFFLIFRKEQKFWSFPKNTGFSLLMWIQTTQMIFSKSYFVFSGCCPNFLSVLWLLFFYLLHSYTLNVGCFVNKQHIPIQKCSIQLF